MVLLQNDPSHLQQVVDHMQQINAADICEGGGHGLGEEQIAVGGEKKIEREL